MPKKDRHPPGGVGRPAGAVPSTPRKFAGFDEATAFLLSRVNVERSRPEQVDPGVFKLDRMRALVRAMGSPQAHTRFVHVAGSKGKGSTCEMLASCLTACGYTTGLYTSPHLIDVRERIRIDREMITGGSFAEHLSIAAAAAGEIAGEFGDATFFELVTATAFSFFARQAVDIAVIEVGLGGRLDSTNIITPDVCAVTAIQLEHTQILGRTLDAIAREKAGIFKPGVPAFTIPQSDPSILAAFREVAARVGAPLRVVGEDLEFVHRMDITPAIGWHARATLVTPRGSFDHVDVPLCGEHQAWNCGLALAVLDELRAHGFGAISESKIADGLSRTPNLGRLEQVYSGPRVIIDGAHNPESIEELMRTIAATYRPDAAVVVFGCAADKDVGGMLQKLARSADKVVFTKASGTPRAMDPRELQRRFHEMTGRTMQYSPSLHDALKLAAKAVHPNDLICVTGSFYLAGEAKKLVLSCTAKSASSEVEPKPPGTAAPDTRR